MSRGVYIMAIGGGLGMTTQSKHLGKSAHVPSYTVRNPTLVAMLRNVASAYWMGWMSFAYIVSFVLASRGLFSAHPATMYVPLLGGGVVLPQNVMLIVEAIVISFTATLGHREMACGTARNEPGAFFDGCTYGILAALFALLICRLPSIVLYAISNPFRFVVVALLCIFSCLLVRKNNEAVKDFLWTFRWSKFSHAMLIMSALTLAPMLMGPSAQVAIELPADASKRTLEANMGTSGVFFDGSWDGMSLQQRTEALGTMAVVLCDHLGIDTPPERIVATTGMDPNTFGYYDRAGAGTIALNAAHLMTEDPLSALDTVSHEMAHVFQWQTFCTGERSQSSSYPYSVDEKKLQGYLASYTGLLPYSERVTEREAFEFGAHYTRLVSAKVCRHLGIDDPFDISRTVAEMEARGEL